MNILTILILIFRNISLSFKIEILKIRRNVEILLLKTSFILELDLILFNLWQRQFNKIFQTTTNLFPFSRNSSLQKISLLYSQNSLYKLIKIFESTSKFLPSEINNNFRQISCSLFLIILASQIIVIIVVVWKTTTTTINIDWPEKAVDFQARN